MKKSYGALLLTILAAALVLNGCMSPVSGNPKAIASGMGMGKIYLNAKDVQGKTLFPDEIASVTYSVTFSDPLGVESPVTRNFSTNHTESLKAGFWNVVVNAVSGGDNVGWDSKSNVEVREAQTTVVEFRIKPSNEPGAPSGTLTWSIKYPVGLVDKAVVEYDNVTFDALNPAAISAYGINTAVTGTRSAVASLPPGSYTFRAGLENNASGKKAGNIDAVHIYPGLNTTLSWEFFEDSFKYTKNYQGSVDIFTSGKVSIASAVLKSTDSNMVSDATLTYSGGNTWVFEISAIEDAASLNNLYVEILTAANGSMTRSYAFGTVTLAPSIVLTPVYMYAFEASAGAGGQISIDDSAPAAALQRDYMAGDPVVLTTIPNSGYEVGALTGLPLGAITVGNTTTFDINTDTTAGVTFVLPAVTNVSISPTTPTVRRGQTQQFTETVTAVGSAIQSVTWSIDETGKNAGTSISATGLLTVSAYEALATLTVRAVSDFDPSKVAFTSVTLTGTIAGGSAVLRHQWLLDQSDLYKDMAGSANLSAKPTSVWPVADADWALNLIHFAGAMGMDAGLLYVDTLNDDYYDLTVSLWFKPDDLSHINNFMQINLYGGLGLGLGVDDYLYCLGWNQNAIGYMNADDNGGLVTPPLFIDDINYSNYEGKWTHIAFTINGSDKTSALYINGVKTGNTLSGIPVPVITGIWIGGIFGPESFADGDYIDVRVYEGLLTGTEIAAIYNAAPTAVKDGPAPPPVGDIKITISVEGDMTFTGLGGSIVLSKGAADTQGMSLTNYPTAGWYVDGNLKSNGVSFTLNALDYTKGPHNLSILVTIDGYIYTKVVSFQVTD